MLPQIPESFIQNKALEYLAERYYRRCKFTDRVFYDIEVTTKERKRADGVVAFLQASSKVFVASLEAKSEKTIRNLTAKLDREKLRYDGIWISILGTFVISLWLWNRGHQPLFYPVWHLILGGTWFASSQVVMKIINPLKLSRHHSIEVLQQLNQYPANEKWIAIGTNSIKKAIHKKKLNQECRKLGIGLLYVRPDGIVKVKLNPTFKNAPPGKPFIRSYLNAKEIRTFLNNGNLYSSFSRLTPGQRKYRYKAFGAAGLFVALLFLIFQVPERSNNQQIETADIWEESIPPSDIQRFPLENKKKQSIKTQENSNVPDQNCSNEKISGVQYIVVDQFYKVEKDAIARVELLHSKGFDDADYLWLPCYINEIGRNSFCVYSYNPRSNWRKANNNLRRFEGKARMEELVVKDPFILKLEARKREIDPSFEKNNFE